MHKYEKDQRSDEGKKRKRSITIKGETNRRIQRRKEGRFDASRANEMIAKVVVDGILSLDNIQTDEFRRLVQFLRPDFKVAEREEMAAVLLPDASARKEEAMRHRMHEVPHLSITVDAWKSIRKDPCMRLALCGVSRRWRFELFDLDVLAVKPKEPSEVLADIIRETLEVRHIPLDRIVAFVSDDVGNLRHAARCLGIKWVPCFDRVLHRSVRSALEADEAKQALVAATDIVHAFRRLPAARLLLKERQSILSPKAKSIVMDDEMRWETTYKMLKRLLALHSVVSSCLATLHDDDSPAPYDLTIPQWKLIRQITATMRTIKHCVTFATRRSVPTLSAAVSLAFCLTSKALKSSPEDSPALAAFKNRLSDGISSAYPVLNESSDALLMTVFLDPRFKRFDFVDDPDERQGFVKRASSKIAPFGLSAATRSHDRSPVLGECHQDHKEPIDDHGERAVPRGQAAPYWRLVDIAHSPQDDPLVSIDNTEEAINREVQHYLSEPTASVFTVGEPMETREANVHALDPLQWWDRREGEYPLLARLARFYLSIVSTSVLP